MQIKWLRIYGSVDNNLQKLVLANCFCESGFNYNAVHKGIYDKNTIGKICGVKEYWIDIIEEITYDNINTLYAGSLVLNHLLNRFDGDMFKALAYYKGSKKNFEPVKKVIRIYRNIKE